MTRLSASALLVGSIPGDNPRQIMDLCARELGAELELYPDGEIGPREEFIQGLAAAGIYGNPGVELAQRPANGWKPQGYHDLWRFRVRPGVKTLQIGRLFYATEAFRSFQQFRALKAEGVIPKAARFLVALPMIDTASCVFVTNAEDYRILFAAMEEALKIELGLILDTIPADELAIQWDCPLETIGISTENSETKSNPPWFYGESLLPKFASMVARMSDSIPEQVVVGLHLCYGDLGNRHIVEPEDLSAVTRMANAAADSMERSLDFVHVPVPIDRHDDAYFAPLDDWRAGSARLYLGLVHERDSLQDNMRRVTAARAHVRDFGISTECGLGRRRPEAIPALLQLHREIARQMGSA